MLLSVLQLSLKCFSFAPRCLNFLLKPWKLPFLNKTKPSLHHFRQIANLSSVLIGMSPLFFTASHRCGISVVLQVNEKDPCLAFSRTGCVVRGLVKLKGLCHLNIWIFLLFCSILLDEEGHIKLTGESPTCCWNIWFQEHTPRPVRWGYWLHISMYLFLCPLPPLFVCPNWVLNSRYHQVIYRRGTDAAAWRLFLQFK